MRARPGDKVKFHDRAGERGIVERCDGDQLYVRCKGTNKLVMVGPQHVTNFSLAARKAWKKMPDRRVGRPVGSCKVERISVTFRVDRALWEKFTAAEANKLITNRTATVNSWIKEKLDSLFSRTD